MHNPIDRFGAAASTLCAIHCALCALLPVAFSALGLGFLIGAAAEWVFTLIAVALAVGALVLGFRQHRSVQVAAMLGIGIVLLLASRGLEMGAHHDHHGEHGAAEAGTEHNDYKADEHAEDSSNKPKVHHNDAQEDHGEDEDATHLAGAAVGVTGGGLLFVGHILNIRVSRRRRKTKSS